MIIEHNSYSEKEIVDLLGRHEIRPTAQRVIIARTILERCTHLSAEDVYRLVSEQPDRAGVSLATVYNTLALLAEKGVVREVIADPSKIFYDPNTAPHHHIFNISTGELQDVDAAQMLVTGLPTLPAGTDLEGVDVIVRVRSPA